MDINRAIRVTESGWVTRKTPAMYTTIVKRMHFNACTNDDTLENTLMKQSLFVKEHIWREWKQDNFPSKKQWMSLSIQRNRVLVPLTIGLTF